MPQQNTVGPGQKQAMSPLAAMTEAEEGEKAKAELSDLLDQIDQIKAEPTPITSADRSSLIVLIRTRTRTPKLPPKSSKSLKRMNVN